MISARKLSLRLGLPAFAAVAALAMTSAPGVAQTAGTPGPVANLQVHGFAAHAPTAAAAVARPAAGVAPAVAWNGAGSPAILFYTGSDGHAYFAPLVPSTSATSAGGHLVGGPGAAFVPAGDIGGSSGFAILFGRGTNNALYLNGAPGKWFNLGGRLTSRPGVAAGSLGTSEAIDVVVRGADGAAWLDHLTTASATWRNVGGRVLAGTAPAAVNTGGTLYVLVVGTDHAVWVRHSTDASHWSGWTSLGGRLSAELGAATPSAGRGIVYARGGDNALWFNEFAGTTTGVTRGWHSAHGRITSGAGASSVGNGTGPTWAVALGNDGHIWANSGVWPAHTWSKAL
jgi:hypothetical protein